MPLYILGLACCNLSLKLTLNKKTDPPPPFPNFIFKLQRPTSNSIITEQLLFLYFFFFFTFFSHMWKFEQPMCCVRKGRPKQEEKNRFIIASYLIFNNINMQRDTFICLVGCISIKRKMFEIWGSLSFSSVFTSQSWYESCGLWIMRGCPD